jgi:hypothetical protein
MKTTRLLALVLASLTFQQSAFPQAALITKLALGALAGWGVYEMVRPADVEAKLHADIQNKLNQNKQKFFDSIHPIGKAREIKVHEVSTQWKNSNPRNLKDLKGYRVVYTIYWSGPLITDGYTKAESYFDADVDRFTNTNVITSNGSTNSDYIDGAISILTILVGGLGIQ